MHILQVIVHAMLKVIFSALNLACAKIYIWNSYNSQSAKKLKLIKKEEKRGINETSHLRNCKIGLCSSAISFFFMAEVQVVML